MGRKTYESIGKPLDGRDNIVVTRQPDFHPPGVHVAATIAEALALGRELAARRGVDEVASSAGPRSSAPRCRWQTASISRWCMASPAGDTRFDAFDPAVWRETAREPMPQGAGDQFPADFIVLDRQELIAAAYGLQVARTSPYTQSRRFICAR